MIYKKNKSLNDLTALILLFIPVILIFLPFFSDQKVLYQEDISSSSYPFFTSTKEMMQKHKLFFWNPYIFSGYPQTGELTSGFYPLYLIFFLNLNTAFSLTIYIFIHIILGILFCYLYLRYLKFNAVESAAGALVFGLSGWFITESRHLNIMPASSFIPLIFLLYEKYKDNVRPFFSLSFLGLVFGFTFILSAQMTALTLIILTLKIIWDLFSKNISFKRSVLLIITSAISGLLISSVYLIQMYNFSHNFMTRGLLTNSLSILFSNTFSFQLNEILPFFIPETTQCINKYGLVTVYAGLIPTFLSLISIFFKSDKKENNFKYFIFLMLIFSFMASLGNYGIINNLLVIILPFYKSFRAPYRYIIFTVFSMSILSSYSIKYLNQKTFFKYFGICILLVLCINSYFLGKKYLFFTDKSFFNEPVFFKAIKCDSKSIFPPRIRFQTNYLPVAFDNWTIPSKISNIAGYDSFIPSYIIETLYFNESGRVPDMKDWLLIQHNNNKIVIDNISSNIMKLYNLKYVLEKKTSNSYQIFKVNDPAKRYFVTGNYEVINDKLKLLKKLNSTGFDIYSKILFLDDPDKPKHSEQIQYEIKPVLFENDKIIMDATLSKPGFLFLSEPYYPDWKVTVDGKLSKIFRADYMFRSVYLDKGTHRIIFFFKPAYFELGLTVSFISFLAVIILCIIFYKKNI